MKNNYWFNFYTPGRKYENKIVLPIVYILMIVGVGILISFMTRPTSNSLLFGFLLTVPTFYSIIYDLIYKIKKARGVENPDNKNARNIGDVISITITVVMGALYLYVGYAIIRYLIPAMLSLDYTNPASIEAICIIGPFGIAILCGISVFFSNLFNSRLSDIFSTIMNISFYIFIINFLVVIIIENKNPDANIFIYITLAFAIISIIYKFIKRRK